MEWKIGMEVEACACICFSMPVDVFGCMDWSPLLGIVAELYALCPMNIERGITTDVSTSVVKENTLKSVIANVRVFLVALATFLATSMRHCRGHVVHGVQIYQGGT